MQTLWMLNFVRLVLLEKYEYEASENRLRILHFILVGVLCQLATKCQKLQSDTE